MLACFVLRGGIKIHKRKEIEIGKVLTLMGGECYSPSPSSRSHGVVGMSDQYYISVQEDDHEC